MKYMNTWIYLHEIDEYFDLLKWNRRILGFT